MISQEIAMPLAYFITFTCYGACLHGGKITSVDWQHNIPGTEYLSFNSYRQTSVKKRISEASYLLEDTQRHIVLSAIKEVCAHRAWGLLAAHVRTNHIHIVVHAIVSPEIIMNSIKVYASHRLNKAKLDGNRVNRWTRHGSTRYLWSEEESAV